MKSSGGSDIKMANRFKSKATAILHGADRRPNSVGDFLKAEEIDNTADLHKNRKSHLSKPEDHQLHKSAKTRLHKPTGTENSSNIGKERLGRLHIEIRQDLADRLLEMVYQRKRNPNIIDRVSTQRAIIEEALEQYFKNHR